MFDRIRALDGTKYGVIDYLKPLTDYQEISYVCNDDGKRTKAEYKSDSQTYGTYNSEGTVYFDSEENAVLKRYYTTDATRYTAYVYDGNELKMICDFGGMAYKGSEDNPDVELGMKLKIFLL